MIERVLAPNPSLYTGPGTNTYLLRDSGEVLIVDPGPIIASHAAAIVGAIGDDTPVGIAVTHTHPDHAPLANPLGDALGIPVLGFATGPEFVPDQRVADVERIENLDQVLVAVDGPAKTAYFDVSGADGQTRREARSFDMLHVCPPQTAPDFIRVSPLADSAGWIDVDQATLRHRTHDNIWSLGDVMNAPNAKTAAAARKQAQEEYWRDGC